jgi:iron complex outermembrane receptor protein
VDSYVRLDSRVSWSLADKVELSVVGQNLLDKRHPEFSESIYSAPAEISRSAYVKLKIEF